MAVNSVYEFREENDYEIHVSGSHGVVVKVWGYEMPHTEEYGFRTSVDPREVRPENRPERMIELGLARVHTMMDEATDEPGVSA